MKQQLLDYIQQKEYRPQTADTLAAAIGAGDRDEFDTLLAELTHSGEIIINRKGKIGPPALMGRRIGRLAVNGKNPGLLQETPAQSPVYIHPARQNGALHGDLVEVRVIQKHRYVNGYEEGEVMQVLERAGLPILAIYSESEQGGGVLRPEDRRHYIQSIVVRPGDELSARDGDRVVATVTRYGDDNHAPEGCVTEILGREDDASQDIPATLIKFGLTCSFPDAVQENAAQVAKIQETDYEGRLDLREWFTVTIDGADARDFDDAVSLEPLANGHVGLGVHIADVAHYVRRGSPLDREAWQRGTSVYLPGCVVPMLPTALSNDICSLNPEVDRLTLSCLMELDGKGCVVSSRVAETVIRSHARLTYDEVNDVLKGGPCQRGEDFANFYQALDDLRKRLNRRRVRRGALTFDLPESKVVCDDQGNVLELRRRRQERAESIIEEAMILANETVAQMYFEQDVPFIYRVHEAPPDDKLLELRDFVALLGYKLPGNPARIRSLDFQKLLNQVSGGPETVLLQQTILRSMCHARYDVENSGHFGIASPCYCHFTSPIRRYPDLAIHRVIKSLLHPETARRDPKLRRRLAEAAVQSSLRERLAEEAERDAVNVKVARYLAAHVGEVYSGVIINVCAFGFFVQLENTAEGLVHVSTLDDDYYEYHEARRCMTGERTGRKFTLGDPVVIRVARVNIPEHLIDFELVNDDGETD